MASYMVDSFRPVSIVTDDSPMLTWVMLVIRKQSTTRPAQQHHSVLSDSTSVHAHTYAALNRAKPFDRRDPPGSLGVCSCSECRFANKF
jgi:hypothetical protein